MLEIKRKELELMRVSTAKFELELKIEEMLKDIERLKAAILIQKETEIKITQELVAFKK
jgi:hypothetical protein